MNSKVTSIKSFFLNTYSKHSFYKQIKAEYTLYLIGIIIFFALSTLLIPFFFASDFNTLLVPYLLSFVILALILRYLKKGHLNTAINLLILTSLLNSIRFITTPLSLKLFVQVILILMATSIIYIKKYQLYISIFMANLFFIIEVFIFKNAVVFLEGNMAIKTLVTLGMSGITFTISALYLSQIINKMVLQSVEKKRIAIVDDLTQLYNRQYFNEVLQQTTDLKNSFLLLLDIDYFKNVNDQFGHDTGDHLLKDFSELLKKETPHPSHIFRWGGEEFLILIKLDQLPLLLSFSEELREKIAKTIFIRNYPITASIGVVGEPIETLDDIDAVISMADHALYKAKQNGRNRVEVFKHL